MAMLRKYRHVPDEILENIFLHLNNAFDLLRTSVVCTTFHKLISDRNLLCRYRSTYPPPVIEIFDVDQPPSYHYAEPPHRFAQAAGAIEQAIDFTFLILPEPNSGWRIRDVRNGRVLLSKSISTNTAVPDLFVCDHLFCRYVQLPSINGPIDLEVSMGSSMEFDPFLTPAEELEKGNEEDASFRVICIAKDRYMALACILSSATRKWASAMSIGFECGLQTYRAANERHLGRNCFYWTNPIWNGRLLVLDMGKTKFLVLDARVSMGLGTAILYAKEEEDKLRLLCLGFHDLRLYSGALVDNGARMEWWQRDKTIPLPPLNFHWWFIIAKADDYVLQSADSKDSAKTERSCFTVHLKTWHVERLCMVDFSRIHVGSVSIVIARIRGRLVM